MFRKTISFSIFLFVGLGFLPQQTAEASSSSPVLNPYVGTTNSQYARYDNKKSRYCMFMRASNCRSVAGLERYIRRGCVNDTDSESRCLKTFCSINCANRECPAPGSQIANACNAHCKYVNLNNSAAQNRLQRCVWDAISASQAAEKAAGRTYDSAQLRAVRAQEKETEKEGARLIKELKREISKRDGIFGSNRGARSTTIRGFNNYVMQAIRVTESIKSMIKNLKLSGHSMNFIMSAERLVRKSDLVMERFIGDAKTLYESALKLDAAIRHDDNASLPQMPPSGSVSPPPYSPRSSYGGSPSSGVRPIPAPRRMSSPSGRPIPAPRRPRRPSRPPATYRIPPAPPMPDYLNYTNR